MNAILKPVQALVTEDAAAPGSALATKLSAKYPGRVTGTLLLPGQAGDYAPMPDDVPEALAGALRSRGIDRLYRHQAQAWAATQAGRHLVVATPTASGKSLCYTLPVLSAAITARSKAL
ncbi:MAG: DEAD/DEAH box helicase, partial [Luteimonas sp.]